MDDTTNKPAKGLSRRTLVAGTAWAVPVVAVGAPAAFAGASQPCTSSGLCLTGFSLGKCCHAQDGWYYACISFTNNSSSPVTATWSFTLNPSASENLTFSGTISNIPAGETKSCYQKLSSTSSNCSSATYPAFNINFQDAAGHTGSAPIPSGATGGNTYSDCGASACTSSC